MFQLFVGINTWIINIFIRNISNTTIDSIYKIYVKYAYEYAIKIINEHG